MKAAVIYEAGAAEQIKIENREIPAPKGTEVLVKIAAFGLNRSEIMTRKGFSPSVVFPRVLGIECVGEIVEDPSSEFLPGQKVAACMGGMGRGFDGSYAEYIVLPKSLIYPFSSDLPWAVLGAIPEMFQTVFGSLHKVLKIRKGETLLVRGGTSSIGILAIQMAKLDGLKVIATTRNKDKDGFLKEVGADMVLIDNGNLASQMQDENIPKADKVFELVGTQTLKDSLQCANIGGTVCMTGMLSEQWSIPNFAPMDYIPAGVNLTVFDSGQILSGRDHFQDFVNAVGSGKIKLNFSKTFHLDEIVQAHQFMESNLANGKIVVLT